MAGDWSDEQNDAIVADYFAILADDIAGRLYSKAEHHRLLQAVIARPVLRSDTSIRISAP